MVNIDTAASKTKVVFIVRVCFVEESQGFGGGMLTTRVAGSDLLIVLERAQKRSERIRGF